MSERDFINQLQRRLMELRCPQRHMRRLVREVADHREDLRQAAGQEGLSGAGAEAWVDARLGDAAGLADQLMATLRRSTWWGRHSLVTFGLMPLLAVPLLWSVVLETEAGRRVIGRMLARPRGAGLTEMLIALASEAQFKHLG